MTKHASVSSTDHGGGKRRDMPLVRQDARALFALLVESAKHSGKFLSFSGFRIDLL